MAVGMTVLFDTNIVIDALNGISAADEEYSRHTIVHISIITWMEVMVGVDERSEMTAAFLRDNFVIQPITQDVAEKAVALRKQYRMKLPDALIWATAWVHSATLVTRNSKDFPTTHPSIRIPYTL